MRRFARAAAAAILLLAGPFLRAQTIPRLSKAERAERIRRLPDEDRRWLEDVSPILFPDEENLFLLLEPNHRAVFEEEFWKRRERDGLPPPLGPGYRRRYEELLRTADERYDGRREDAGKMVLAHGEPASIQTLEDCRDLFRDLEIWTYSETRGGMASTRRYLFFRRSPGAPRRLWSYGDSDSDLLQPMACRKSFAELARWECPRPPNASQLTDHCFFVANCAATCRVVAIWQELRVQQGSALGGRTEQGRTLASPEVSREDLPSLAARFPEVSTAGSRTIAIESPGKNAETAAVPAKVRLSPREIAEAKEKLAPRYREFLDLADPLLTDEERSRFLQLSDGEKDDFVRTFWKKHSK